MNKKYVLVRHFVAKPFIKWAGGKRQLLDAIKNLYPENLGRDISKYCEPFIGAGAVLFDVLQRYCIEEAYISDINKPLIMAYETIKSSTNSLIDELNLIANQFNSLPSYDYYQKEYYLERRSEFNNLKFTDDNNIRISALFIFLNKTCFNGLYRVNKNGEFNVPFGNYTSFDVDEENIYYIRGLLKSTKIVYGTYEECESFVDDKTFVYMDPPYRPLNTTSSFNSYTELDFNDDSQKRLSIFARKLVKKGATVLISNSDPKNIDRTDEFFDDLYKGFTIYRIQANRTINSIGTGRTKVSELLIRSKDV